MKKSFRFSPAQPGKHTHRVESFFIHLFTGPKTAALAPKAHSGLSAFSGHRPFCFILCDGHDAPAIVDSPPLEGLVGQLAQHAGNWRRPTSNRVSASLASDREADAHRRQPTAPLRRRNCLCGPVVLTRCLGGDLPLPAIFIGKVKFDNVGILILSLHRIGKFLSSRHSRCKPRVLCGFRSEWRLIEAISSLRRGSPDLRRNKHLTFGRIELPATESLVTPSRVSSPRLIRPVQQDFLFIAQFVAALWPPTSTKATNSKRWRAEFG